MSSTTRVIPPTSDRFRQRPAESPWLWVGIGSSAVAIHGLVLLAVLPAAQPVSPAAAPESAAPMAIEMVTLPDAASLPSTASLPSPAAPAAPDPIGTIESSAIAIEPVPPQPIALPPEPSPAEPPLSSLTEPSLPPRQPDRPQVSVTENLPNLSAAPELPSPLPTPLPGPPIAPTDASPTDASPTDDVNQAAPVIPGDTTGGLPDPTLPSNMLDREQVYLPPALPNAPTPSPSPAGIPLIPIDQAPPDVSATLPLPETPASELPNLGALPDPVPLELTASLTAIPTETGEPIAQPQQTEQVFESDPQRSACLVQPEVLQYLGSAVSVQVSTDAAGQVITTSVQRGVGNDAYDGLAQCLVQNWTFNPALSAEGFPIATNSLVVSIVINR